MRRKSGIILSLFAIFMPLVLFGLILFLPDFNSFYVLIAISLVFVVFLYLRITQKEKTVKRKSANFFGKSAGFFGGNIDD